MRIDFARIEVGVSPLSDPVHSSASRIPATCEFSLSNSPNAAATVVHPSSEATNAKSARYSVHAEAGISRPVGSHV